MSDLTVVIPALNEEFLQRTIDDVLRKAKGDTEVIAILDGYWPDEGIKQHPKLTVVHHEEPSGQRQSVNEGIKLSDSKYIMKLDAHCCLDKGFDVKLMEDCDPDWTVLPRMYTLHAFDWKCSKCGNRTYQGPRPVKCENEGCDNTTDFERVMVWNRNLRKRTDYMWICPELRMRYFDGHCLKPYGDPHELKRKCHHKFRAWAKNDITDVMVGVGCCFFMHRDRYLELGGLDETHGSWGQMAVEVAMKSWLSSGRQVINKKTWFAHLFRTGGGFGFPYKISHNQQEAARQYSRDLWMGDKWEGQKRKFQWVIDKFGPLPGWHITAKEKAVTETKELESPTPSRVSQPTKGIIYYTDNMIEDRLAITVRNQLKKCCYGAEIVSVSQYPIDLGRNIVVPWKRSVLTMFKQILEGLEASTANIVFLTEHDVFYHPSHFDFTPPTNNAYYYNENVWSLDAKTGKVLFYKPRQQVSGLCAYRSLLLEHYRARVKRVEKEGFTLRLGYEPGKRPPRGIDRYKKKGWFSEHPNVDIKQKCSLTPGRFKLEQYRCKDKIKDSWILTDELPFWGSTNGKDFGDILAMLSGGSS